MKQRRSRLPWRYTEEQAVDSLARALSFELVAALMGAIFYVLGGWFGVAVYLAANIGWSIFFCWMAWRRNNP